MNNQILLKVIFVISRPLIIYFLTNALTQYNHNRACPHVDTYDVFQNITIKEYMSSYNHVSFIMIN